MILNLSKKNSEHFPTGYVVMYYDAIILRDCENMNLQPRKKKMHRRIFDFEFHFLGGKT